MNDPCAHKRAFRRKGQASRAIKEMERQQGRHLDPLHDYRCPYCGLFHITSQSRWNDKQRRELMG